MILLVEYVSAQDLVTLRFESLTINNGLSQGYVSSIMQDKKGLMWFATGDGLNKYDGYSFTVYHHNPDDSTSLGSDDLTCVFEDSKGRLWVGTRYNGIDLFLRDKRTFVHITHENSRLRSNIIKNITEDKTGALWIRTQRGTERMEIIEKTVLPAKPSDTGVRFKDSIAFTHITMDSAFAVGGFKQDAERIFVDSRGSVLITTNKKIWELIYDAKHHTYELEERFSFTPLDSSIIAVLIEDTATHSMILNDRNIVKFPHHNFTDPQIQYQQTRTEICMAVDNRHTLWFVDNGGMVQLDLKTGIERRIRPADPLQERILRTASAIFTDRTGMIWIGSSGYGLVKYDPEMEQFHHLMVGENTYQLLQSKSGLIIANNFKAIDFTQPTPVVLDHFIDSSGIRMQFPKVGVVSFTKDSADLLWMGIHGGLVSYNMATKITNHYDLPARNSPTLPFPVYADKRNYIWMGYNRTFLRYHINSGEIKNFDYPVEPNSYNYDFMQCMYEDNDIMWFGTVNGLFCIDTKTDQIIRTFFYSAADQHSLSNNFILSLCNDVQDPANYIWVGTKGGGLNRLNKKTGKCTRFLTENGLANNVVYGILPDDEGNLWISTNKGISALDTKTLVFKNFDISDGLQSNEFNRYAYCKTNNGLLLFGGMNGINYFDPKEIRTLESPTVILTDFRLFNKRIEPNEKEPPLESEIEFANKILLKYDQNMITFQFAAMDYRKHTKIRYRYMMEGFDKDWVQSGSVNEATYTNLDPGDYRFLTQARFENGEWGPEYAVLVVVVVPPWWKTWWFNIIVAITVMSLLTIAYRIRVNQLLKVERLRNRIARDLHDEVGSSISTIAIYSKIVQEQANNASFDNKPLLKKITDYATEIMEVMNDIIWNINTKNDAFEHIISKMREHAYQLLEAKDYKINFSFDESLYKMKLSMEKRRDFYLIYKESVNNIAKYANGKNAWIEVYVKDGSINLVVKDDGKGFETDTMRKGGNGLLNMQHRAKALNATITITSAPGEGTKIHLVIKQ